MSFLGNYRGKVLSHGTHGRCKIYVPSVHPADFEGITPDSSSYASKLPWTEPAMPIFGNTTEGQGIQALRAIDTYVWVFFEGGDIRDPVYFATIPGGTTWISQDKDDYVIHTKKTKININDSSDVLNIKVESGSVNITTPITNINGDLHVTGNIKGDQEVEDKTATMTQDRTIFDAHIHIAPQAPAGTLPTKPPTTKQQ